ncbi:glycosyltransferase [uncultured Friedmanniella sp.]|uniref:glycosyltransferase n=1 Tax=uncultured Friedmanniella sp. TaxID=335381 RepID=UPI0035CC5819
MSVAGGPGRGVLVHEWIAQAGGSENVFEAMNDIYPDADLVCLWNDSTGRFNEEQLKQTWLSRTPLRRSKALALPFMPATWRRLAYEDYEWALISSHLFAHHARFVGQPAGFRRYVYVHTPARYIWSPELDGRGNSLAARTVAAALKPIDRRRAQEPASYAANSAFVRTRIQDAWGVEAQVIFPPVEVEAIQGVEDWRTRLTEAEQEQLDGLPDGFVLGASRFIPYKRLDVVIRTAEAAGRPVVLAGKGPELENLQAVAREASVPVQFVHAPSGPMLWALYQRTSLYVFPAVEDFGIMPVEAMAAGAPVLAQSVGGTAESVVPGETGALVPFRSRAEMAEGAEAAMATVREARLNRARDFSRRRFEERITGWVGAA